MYKYEYLDPNDFTTCKSILKEFDEDRFSIVKSGQAIWLERYYTMNKRTYNLLKREIKRAFSDCIFIA